jgi:hypothetical protein
VPSTPGSLKLVLTCRVLGPLLKVGFISGIRWDADVFIASPCFPAHMRWYCALIHALTWPRELAPAAQERDWGNSMPRQAPDIFPIIRSVPGAWRAQEGRDERVRVLWHS